jgi:hypothetical protein
MGKSGNKNTPSRRRSSLPQHDFKFTAWPRIVTVLFCEKILQVSIVSFVFDERRQTHWVGTGL